MQKRRADRRNPPSGLALQMRLNEVMVLYDQVCHLMDGCPDVLVMKPGSDARRQVGAVL